MKYALNDFSAGAKLSVNDLSLGFQPQILKINNLAAHHLEDRLPEEVHNLMILVDEVTDDYLTRMNEAFKDDCQGEPQASFRLGFGGLTAFELFRRCYLEAEEFADIKGENINILELWSAFALARTSDAISCLIGNEVDSDIAMAFGGENAGRYALAGDALIQATEATFMIERIQKGMSIDGESRKDKNSTFAAT